MYRTGGMGVVAYLNGDATLYQGLGLKGGDTLGQTTRYTIDVQLAVSDSWEDGSIQLYAYDRHGDQYLSIGDVKPGHCGDAQLMFEVPETRSSIEIGLILTAGVSDNAWALLTNARLSFRQE